MITAIIVTVCGFLLWLFGLVRTLKTDNAELKAKEVTKEIKDEAVKVVDSKSSTDLVDDFNKRYPGEGS